MGDMTKLTCGVVASHICHVAVSPFDLDGVGRGIVLKLNAYSTATNSSVVAEGAVDYVQATSMCLAIENTTDRPAVELAPAVDRLDAELQV